MNRILVLLLIISILAITALVFKPADKYQINIDSTPVIGGQPVSTIILVIEK